MDTQNVSPTKGTLLATKKSLELARMGRELMERKHGILVREMMLLIERANKLRGKIDDTYSRAYSALQSANITLGVVDSIADCSPVENGVSISVRSVMGVELPTVRIDDRAPALSYDFTSSNCDFDEAFISFHNVKLMLADLAELENSVYRLAVAIRKTQSRQNALKNIIIPNFEETCRYISDALEEKEREEFSRLKVIKKSKAKARR
jgi:V/A-type H+-transporting ATPase subunit D